MSGLCNLCLQQFSLFYIQTLHNDCSHIEDVHLLFIQISYGFCSHVEVLNLDIVSLKMLRRCLVCVICNSNSFHSLIFKLCIMNVQTLNMYIYYTVLCAHLIDVFYYLGVLDLAGVLCV